MLETPRSAEALPQPNYQSRFHLQNEKIEIMSIMKTRAQPGRILRLRRSLSRTGETTVRHCETAGRSNLK